MSKASFISIIISTIIFIVATSIYFVFDEFIYAYFPIVILIIFANIIIKQKQKDKFSQIIFNYVLYCDLDKYLQDLDKFQKKFFQTKSVVATYDLYRARAYIDKGDFDTSKDYLLKVEKVKNKLNVVATFIYLKTWNDYYYFNYDVVKMENSLLFMKDILDKLGNKNKNVGQLIQLYCTQECKFYILNRTKIEKAKEFFLKRKKIIPKSGILVINDNFELGLISLIEKDYYSAYNIFKKITNVNLSDEFKNNIYIIKKSQEFEKKLREFVDA